MFRFCHEWLQKKTENIFSEHYADIILRDATDKIHQMAVHVNNEITANTAEKDEDKGRWITTLG